MKRLAILLFIAAITLGCLSVGKLASSPTETAIPSTQTSTPKKPTATSVPPTRTPTSTPKPTLIPTINPIDAVIARVAEFNNPELDSLAEEFLYSDYNTIADDFLEGNYQTNLYHGVYNRFYPKEFLAITDVYWSHSTDRIRHSSAGCGYTFYDHDGERMYFVLFTLDNQARLTEVEHNYWDGIKHVKDNSLQLSSPNGKANIMMVILGGRIVFAVNGKIMIDQTVDWKSSGNFGYSLLSGSFKDYGTRCTFTNSEVLVNEYTPSINDIIN